MIRTTKGMDMSHQLFCANDRIRVVSVLPVQAPEAVQQSLVERFGDGEYIVDAVRLVCDCTCGMGDDSRTHYGMCPVNRSIRHPQMLRIQGFEEVYTGLWFELVSS